jgi:hypothetical protein
VQTDTFVSQIATVPVCAASAVPHRTVVHTRDHFVEVRSTRLAHDERIVGHIQPGVYPINTTVTIVGTVSKGQPYYQRQVNGMNPMNVIAFLLGKMNKRARTQAVNELICKKFQVTPEPEGTIACASLKANTSRKHRGKSYAEVTRTFC